MGGLTVFRLYFVSLCCFMYNVFVLCIVIYCNSVEINIHSFIHSLNRCKGHLMSEMTNLPLFCDVDTFIAHSFKICSVTCPLFWHGASPGWCYWWTVNIHIWSNYSWGHFHYIGKSIWFIFDNLYILISGIEVLSQYIASCGFSGVILVLSSNFIGVDAF